MSRSLLKKPKFQHRENERGVGYFQRYGISLALSTQGAGVVEGATLAAWLSP
jgi:hypothetical protein